MDRRVFAYTGVTRAKGVREKVRNTPHIAPTSMSRYRKAKSAERPTEHSSSHIRRSQRSRLLRASLAYEREMKVYEGVIALKVPAAGHVRRWIDRKGTAVEG